VTIQVIRCGVQWVSCVAARPRQQRVAAHREEHPRLAEHEDEHRVERGDEGARVDEGRHPVHPLRGEDVGHGASVPSSRYGAMPVMTSETATQSTVTTASEPRIPIGMSR
jgi:hypothetical protein